MVLYVLVFAEHAVDVLEFAVRGFGVEEVDDGDEGGVEDGPDDVELPLQGLDAYWGDLDDHEVEGPIGGGPERCAFGTHG